MVSNPEAEGPPEISGRAPLYVKLVLGDGMPARILRWDAKFDQARAFLRLGARMVDYTDAQHAKRPRAGADMSTKRYTVTCHWDEEAEVWYVAETDVPGLATEAATVEEMEGKLLRMIPELVTLNEARQPNQPVPFELITRKDELAQCA